MEFEDYLKMVGSITRASAVRDFGLTHRELAEGVANGLLLVWQDPYNGWRDRFRLAHPETIHPIDLRGRIYTLRDQRWRISLDRFAPGFWRCDCLDKRRPPLRQSTRQLLRRLSL